MQHSYCSDIAWDEAQIGSILMTNISVSWLAGMKTEEFSLSIVPVAITMWSLPAKRGLSPLPDLIFSSNLSVRA